MQGDLATSAMSGKNLALLEFAELLTTHSHRTTPEHIQVLRDIGWSDPEIAEAVYVIAMFAFFNRVANAFGLDEPNLDTNESE